MAEETPTPKPGVQTSEFWQANIALLVGVGLMVYGIMQKNDAIIALGVTLSGISNGAYAISRGLAKQT